MIIANALYFKGEWMYGFNKDLTINKDFYTAEQVYKVPMMCLEEILSYGLLPEINAEFVELPYKVTEPFE